MLELPQVVHIQPPLWALEHLARDPQVREQALEVLGARVPAEPVAQEGDANARGRRWK